MKIRRRDDGNVTVLELSGNFTGGQDSYDFEREIEQLIDEDRLNTVISFKNVKWINSPGIGILVRNYSHYLRFGGQMVICQLNTRISIVFDLMLRKVFEIYETVEEAVKVVRERDANFPKKDVQASATS
jgi:anti-anti-sigma factor